MEIVLAILAFIAACAALMFSDYYKPSRFRISYRSFPDKRPRGGDSANYHTSDGMDGGHFGAGNSDGSGEGGGGD